MAPIIRAFQIFYDEATRASLDPDFEPLDNTNADRMDWYEYWPMWRYLQRQELDETSYYGFLSPRFREKTGLTGRQVKDFILESDGADVFTFSPFPCHGAFFVNVFEHGELFHPGLLDVATRFFASYDLRRLVQDSRTTVFCNYVFAKPSFWRTWVSVLESLYEAAETPGSPLREALNRPVEYKKEGAAKPVSMKVFVMERAVSLLLSNSRSFVVQNYPPFRLPVTREFTGKLQELLLLDALKIAFSETGDPQYLQLFMNARTRVAPPGNE